MWRRCSCLNLVSWYDGFSFSSRTSRFLSRSFSRTVRRPLDSPSSTLKKKSGSRVSREPRSPSAAPKTRLPWAPVHGKTDEFLRERDSLDSSFVSSNTSSRPRRPSASKVSSSRDEDMDGDVVLNEMDTVDEHVLGRWMSQREDRQRREVEESVDFGEEEDPSLSLVGSLDGEDLFDTEIKNILGSRNLETIDDSGDDMNTVDEEWTDHILSGMDPIDRRMYLEMGGNKHTQEKPLPLSRYYEVYRPLRYSPEFRVSWFDGKTSPVVHGIRSVYARSENLQARHVPLFVVRAKKEPLDEKDSPVLKRYAFQGSSYDPDRLLFENRGLLIDGHTPPHSAVQRPDNSHLSSAKQPCAVLRGRQRVRSYDRSERAVACMAYSFRIHQILVEEFKTNPNVGLQHYKLPWNPLFELPSGSSRREAVMRMLSFDRIEMPDLRDKVYDFVKDNFRRRADFDKYWDRNGLTRRDLHGLYWMQRCRDRDLILAPSWRKEIPANADEQARKLISNSLFANPYGLSLTLTEIVNGAVFGRPRGFASYLHRILDSRGGVSMTTSSSSISPGSQAEITDPKLSALSEESSVDGIEIERLLSFAEEEDEALSYEKPSPAVPVQDRDIEVVSSVVYNLDSFVTSFTDHDVENLSESASSSVEMWDVPPPEMRDGAFLTLRQTRRFVDRVLLFREERERMCFP